MFARRLAAAALIVALAASAGFLAPDLIAGIPVAAGLSGAPATGGSGRIGSILEPLAVTVVDSSTISSGGELDWHGRATVVRRPDGVLVLVYRRATAHYVNDGALYIRFSADDGASWTDENRTLGGQPVGGFPMNPAVLSSGQDAGEPWVYATPHGDLLLHMWRVKYSAELGGTYQSRSRDGGASWSPAVGPVAFAGQTPEEDLRTFATDDDMEVAGVIYAGARVYEDVDGNPAALSLITSADDGATWTRRSTILTADEADGQGGQEVGLVYVGHGRLIAMIRDNAHTHSYERVSTDMGVTWGPLADVTETLGIAARQRIHTRAQLRGEPEWWNDPVLIMGGFVHQVSGESQSRRNAIWISRDSGTTWSPPFYVDATTEDAGYGDMYYSARRGHYVFVTYQGTREKADLVQYELEIDGL